MDPVTMLKSFFPTSSERFAARQPGTAAAIPRAAVFGPAVILGGALRDPEQAKKLDPMLLAQFGDGGRGSGAEAEALKRLTEYWGPLVGGAKSHAVARVGQSVKVGDDSLVETGGRGTIQTGANSTVSVTGDFDGNVRVGNRSVVNGGSANDSVIGGDSVAVRGGRGNDFIYVKDGGIVSGDAGKDNITAGRYSAIDGGTGDDILSAGAGSTIAGGEGADTIRLEGVKGDTLSYDPALLVGGQGNDSITVRNATADIEYRRGDGSDIIQGDLATSALKLVDLRPSDISFQKVTTGDGSEDLIVKISDSSDTVTIKNAGSSTNGAFSILLRGGSEMVVSDIMAGL